MFETLANIARGALSALVWVVVGRTMHGWWAGRHTSWEPLACHRCGWMGARRWAVHDYRDDGSGEDVEPVDECPRCGQEI